ncbi:MAG: 2-phosphosulfolactate phosphatase, partial [Actinomycetota bacterium]
MEIKMLVDVLLSNSIGEDTLRVNIKGSVCGVIDVIRATSTITTLLAKGISKIIIADSKKDALSLKENNGGCVLCGEEGGLPPKGFDYGNSPLEISRLRNLKGKNAILKTTNGTVSFFRVKKSVAAYSMSILNLDYTV